MKNTLATLLFALTLTSNAHAELISLDSDFGQNTITYDTQTKLAWLDVYLTYGNSYNSVTGKLQNDTAFSHFKMASLEEFTDIVNKTLPSIYTATSFYLGRQGSPFVDTTESRFFRELFGNGAQVIYGQISDGSTKHWAGSNAWNVGQVAYSNAYLYPDGQTLTPTLANETVSNRGWFLNARGVADLNTGYFNATEYTDVTAPFAILGALGLLIMGLRRPRATRNS